MDKPPILGEHEAAYFEEGTVFAFLLIGAGFEGGVRVEYLGKEVLQHHLEGREVVVRHEVLAVP